jgi:hypothetical protein
MCKRFFQIFETDCAMRRKFMSIRSRILSAATAAR